MEKIINKIKKSIESYLTENIENEDKAIDFILYNPKTNESYVLASNSVDEIILFAPYTKNYPKGYTNVPDWDFNLDEYFFKELQNGYEIGFITNDVNYGLWSTIDEFYPEDIENIKGVQKYLKYCVDNNITKEKLSKLMNNDVPDIMKFYQEQNANSLSDIKESNKALFRTKIESDMKHNGEIVDVIDFQKGKDIYSDRYTIKFNDGTIRDNIMSAELNFNYSKKKDERSR